MTTTPADAPALATPRPDQNPPGFDVVVTSFDLVLRNDPNRSVGTLTRVDEENAVQGEPLGYEWELIVPTWDQRTITARFHSSESALQVAGRVLEQQVAMVRALDEMTRLGSNFRIE